VNSFESNNIFIQSCITTVSFPETIQGVLNMVKGNKAYANWATDLDTFINYEREKPLFWTAPQWLTEGDIMFFYLAKRTKTRIKRLLTETQEKFPQKRSLIKLLKRAQSAADLYAGNIFACATVSGSTQLFEQQNKHFVSRLFAPLDKVHIFEKPVKQEIFSDYLRIGLSTITPLYKKEFDGLKNLLAKNNDLPSFLITSELGDKLFRNINHKNWRSISCSSNAKFIHEGQLRNYLIDFFLNEIKDKGTTVLEECECFRGKRNTGRADYFVKIFGLWFPVEAKLDISKEKKLLVQIEKYANINSFVPSKGKHRNNRFDTKMNPLTLIIDKSGLYFAFTKNEFVKIENLTLKWKREEFTEFTAIEVREELKTYF